MIFWSTSSPGSEMNYKQSLSEHIKNYDPEFWKTYNIIKQSPLDEKIIRDLKAGSEKADMFD